MLEPELSHELELFKVTNSIFFIKTSTSFLSFISSNNLSTLPSNSFSPSSSLSCSFSPAHSSLRSCRKRIDVPIGRRVSEFLSVSLSVKGSDGFVGDSTQVLGQNGDKIAEEEAVAFQEVRERKANSKVRGSGAINTTKHLWAGAVAAMVSRTVVAPLERLKLEYIVRGEQKNLFELIKTIASTQGIRGFWKGNFVNILRTAPFKAINFYAYDTYKNQLLKISGNEEATNFNRFLAGAAAGITATLLCLPMDTIRTIMVAPGGEALGGLIGAFRHVIRTEGFFSLYKGLVPSIASMAPSGAVFYGVYDILKSAYLHSPEGAKRIQNVKQQGQDLSALDQLELGPIRTLIYGAIAGACSEAATYPFEVVRRQLQMQVRETKLSAIATCMKIAEQGGVPAFYAGLIPSLLQGDGPGILFRALGERVFLLWMLPLSYISGMAYQPERKYDASLKAIAPVSRNETYSQITNTTHLKCAFCFRYRYYFGCFWFFTNQQVRDLTSAFSVGKFLQVLPSAAISYFVYEFMKIVLEVES